MGRALTDAEIIAALEAEEAVAVDGSSGLLASERANASDRYRGLPLGNEQEGRSEVVSRDVADTIESIMPSLVRVYLGSEDIGQFEARGPEDEEAAKVETEVCNWYLVSKSDYFSVINSTLRDALLLKNGYIACNWTVRKDVMTETYTGQSDDELAMLMQDPEVTVVEHTSYPDPLGAPAMSGTVGPMPPSAPLGAPPMLHDVKVERKAADEYVGIESVPPDEIIVSRNHRTVSLLDCDFVEWKRKVSIGQLRAEGFDVPDDAGDDDEDFGTSQFIARERYKSTHGFDDVPLDPNRRMVTFRDAYIRMDVKGGKNPKLWRMARVSGSDKFALKEEVDVIPFAAFAAIQYPHSHIGTSEFDLIDDVSQIKTQLQRNFLDGQYLALSGQTAVDVNRVNVDDWLVARPGGIKRVDGPVGDAFAPLPITDMGASTLQALNYWDGVKQMRTGVSGNRDALEPNSLNKTATGVQAQQAANNMRVELIARTLAGGFRDLFLVTHALALKHSTKPIQIKLKGKWTPVNPREWTRRTDFVVSVGLGTGTPEAQMSKLMSLAPMMAQGQMAGLVGPEEMYNYGCEVLKAAGYRLHNKFIKEPQKDPQTGQAKMPPPQPDPAVQVATIKAQSDQTLKQMEQQDNAHRFQAEDMLKQRESQMAMELQRSNDERQSALDQQKAALEAQARAQQMELDRYKIELETQSKKEIEAAKIQAQIAIKQMEMEFQSNMQTRTEATQAQGKDEIAQIKQRASAPKTVLRDTGGRVVGVDHGGMVHDVVRDAQGRISGLKPRAQSQTIQ